MILGKNGEVYCSEEAILEEVEENMGRNVADYFREIAANRDEESTDMLRRAELHLDHMYCLLMDVCEELEAVDFNKTKANISEQLEDIVDNIREEI